MPSKIKHKLTELGLGKNEAAVYLELLQLELTTVGPIVKRTKLHRQLVYEALEGLIERGLATRVSKNRRKHYQASSPEKLRSMLEQRRLLTESVLPELLNLQKLGEDRVEVNTLYGSSAIFQNLQAVAESAARTDKVIRIIGGAPAEDFYQALGSDYEAYTKLLEKMKLKKLLLAPDAGSKAFKKHFVSEKRTTLRTMKSGLSAPTYTRITKEMTTIEIYSNDLLVVQIINKAIAVSYLEHFELLWAAADA